MTTYTYDADGRVVEASVSGGSANTITYNYTAGRLVERSGLGVTYQWQFDGEDRLVSYVETDANTFSYTWSYDAQGRLREASDKIDIQDEPTVRTYTYNEDATIDVAIAKATPQTITYTVNGVCGRLSERREPPFGGAELIEYEYNEFGLITRILTYGEGSESLPTHESYPELRLLEVEEDTYDDRARLLTRTRTLYGGVVDQVEYSWDEDGNLKSTFVAIDYNEDQESLILDYSCW